MLNWTTKTIRKEADMSVFLESERRLEGIMVIIGSLADTNNSPELEAVQDLLMDVLDTMRTAINTDGKDME